MIVFGGIANQAFSVYSSMWLSDWSADPNNTVAYIRDRYLGVYGGLGIGQSNLNNSKKARLSSANKKKL